MHAHLLDVAITFVGKTLLAKAVANQTSATFLRVCGSELIQKYLVSPTASWNYGGLLYNCRYKLPFYTPTVPCPNSAIQQYAYTVHVYVMYKPWPRGVYVRYTPAVRNLFVIYHK